MLPFWLFCGVHGHLQCLPFKPDLCWVGHWTTGCWGFADTEVNKKPDLFRSNDSSHFNIAFPEIEFPFSRESYPLVPVEIEIRPDGLWSLLGKGPTAIVRHPWANILDPSGQCVASADIATLGVMFDDVEVPLPGNIRSIHFEIEVL